MGVVVWVRGFHMKHLLVSDVICMRVSVCRALWNNTLSGPIPQSMGKLTALQTLWVACGQQTSIHVPIRGGSRFLGPTDCVIKSMKCILGKIAMFRSKLEVKFLTPVPIIISLYLELRSVVHMPNINMCPLCPMFGLSRYLYNNQLSGPIPSSIGNLGALEYSWVPSIQ